MKVYHKTLGGHVHMRVFVNGAKMGDLCCRVDEFFGVQQAMRGCAFISEDDSDATLS